MASVPTKFCVFSACVWGVGPYGAEASTVPCILAATPEASNGTQSPTEKGAGQDRAFKAYFAERFCIRAGALLGFWPRALGGLCTEGEQEGLRGRNGQTLSQNGYGAVTSRRNH